MENLNVLFPTLIYETTIEQHNFKLEDILRNIPFSISNDWRCDMKTTFDTYDIIKDESFQNILNAITKEVSQFSKTFGASGNVRIVDAWINMSSTGSYQEYHIHPDSHFSVVYYLKSDGNSGNIVFRSHEANNDMFMIPIIEMKPASYKTCAFKPITGKLLIFRLNLQHMVEKNRTNEDRISLSANFIVDL